MKIFLGFLVIDSPQGYTYNYGLGYIAAVLKSEGHEVYMTPLQSQADVDHFCGRIARERPRIVGFSSTTSQFSYLQDILKRIPPHPDTLLIAGGVHATLSPDCIHDAPELDGICRGEGEFPMVDLARAVEAGEDYTRIPNFWFRKDGQIIRNEMRPILKSLDDLPFPHKEDDYQKVLDRAGGNDRFVFSRGCPFKCSYCSNEALSLLYGKDFLRRRSPHKAIEEIRMEVDRYHFNHISLDDDMVTLDKNWFYEFFPLYAKEFKHPFDCNIRPGHITEDMVRELKKAGCAYVYIGVEHGNEEFRRKVMNRNMTNAKIVETFDLFRKHGIVPMAHVMVGLPYETTVLFWDTVKLFRKLGVKWNYLSIFSPYPGTELYDLCKKNHWLPERTGYREREDAVVGFPGFSKEEIQQCHDLFPILLRWPMIPAWLMHSQKLWGPAAIRISRTSQALRGRFRKPDDVRGERLV